MVSNFMGFSVEAIVQWDEVTRGRALNPCRHLHAIEESLIVSINDEVFTAPENPTTWVALVKSIQRMGNRIVDAAPAPVDSNREFGCGDTATQTPEEIPSDDQEEHTEIPAEDANTKNEPEVFAGVETASTSEEPECPPTAPTVSSPDIVEPPPSSVKEAPISSPTPAAVVQCESVVEPVITEPSPATVESEEKEPVSQDSIPANDNLRAKIGALPSYYSPLKEPLNKLVDFGADLLVIDTALELAGKPYNLGQIADYARHISINANDSRDLMALIQAAHRASCKIENTTDANVNIMDKIMAFIPDNRKSVFKGRLEQQIKDGQDKYWAEAWGQTEAAHAAGRTTTPVNLFMNIVKDLERNTSLAEQRGSARIKTFADCRWIMEYLPKTQVDYSETALNRGSRKFYLPKMKETIERQGFIPLTWVMAIIMDNDYPTRALTGLADKMIEKYPALARIVTREQFEYAMTLVARIFLERADRVEESWEGDCSKHHLGSSLTHHAVYAGKCYMATLREYSENKCRFMDSLKDTLNITLSNAKAMMIMDDWYLDNPWRHGKNPEDSHAHRQEERAFNARSEAFRAEERRQAELGTSQV